MATTRSLLACPRCDVGPFTRNHYFTGKLLVERDFKDEQRYYIDKLRHHHQRLHGRGVVCGLRVKEHPNPACRDRFVCIEPGTAIDCCGREIVLREEECVDLTGFEAIRTLRDEVTAEAGRHTIQLRICYRECPTEEIPVLYDECGCDETQCAPNRILESHRWDVRVDPPEAAPEDPTGARLERVHTLDVARAHRVAYDPDHERIYVLSANAPDGPANLVAFRASDHALVRATSFGATEEVLDLALSADGSEVYVALRATAETNPLQVRVLEADLDDLRPGDALTLPDGADGDVRLAAAPDGRLYALDVDGGHVYGWDQPATDTVDDRLGPVAVGPQPRAIRVAPDGSHVFVANRGDATISVIDAGDLTAGPIATLAAPATDPGPLAVASTTGGVRLFVAGDDGTLAVFRAQPEAAEPYALAGSVTLPAAPVALATSPAGRWVYALTEDGDGRGRLRVVDAHAVEASGPGALGASVGVGREPRALATGGDGHRIYAAYAGAAEGEEADDGPAGGVAVIEVSEADCASLLEQLDCPECHEPDCLVLATIRDYAPGQDITDARIDNVSDRPILPSTSRLADAVRCLLRRGGGAGEPGEAGPPGLGIDDVVATFVDCEEDGSARIETIDGARTLVLEVPRGCDGETGAPGTDGAPGADGQDGLGLNADLPKILDIGWQHRDVVDLVRFIESHRYDASPEEVRQRVENSDYPLLTVYFNRRMTGVDRQTARVFLRAPQISGGQFMGMYSIFNVDAYLYPLDLGGGHDTPHTGESDAWAWALVPDRRFVHFVAQLLAAQLTARLEEEIDLPCIHVVLKGDFIHGLSDDGDFDEALVLDADNIGGMVGENRMRAGPITGGNNPSGDLVQGGDFESWFFLRARDQVPGVPSHLRAAVLSVEALFAGVRSVAATPLNLNTASDAELRDVAGIGTVTAGAIVAERERQPFRSLEEVRERVSISERNWMRMRDSITVRPREG